MEYVKLDQLKRNAWKDSFDTVETLVKTRVNFVKSIILKSVITIEILPFVLLIHHTISSYLERLQIALQFKETLSSSTSPLLPPPKKKKNTFHTRALDNSKMANNSSSPSFLSSP